MLVCTFCPDSTDFCVRSLSHVKSFSHKEIADIKFFILIDELSLFLFLLDQNRFKWSSKLNNIVQLVQMLWIYQLFVKIEFNESRKIYAEIVCSYKHEKIEVRPTSNTNQIKPKLLHIKDQQTSAHSLHLLHIPSMLCACLAWLYDPSYNFPRILLTRTVNSYHKIVHRASGVSYYYDFYYFSIFRLKHSNECGNRI